MPVDRTLCKRCLFFDDDRNECALEIDWMSFSKECHNYQYCPEKWRKEIVGEIRRKWREWGWVGEKR
jgi:hypothetical protein